MTGIGAWLSGLVSWLLGLVQSALGYLVAAAQDLVLVVVNAALQALASIIAAIPVPHFAASGLAPFFAALPSGILFFVGEFQLPAILAMFAAAFSFRFARKVATLFQW